MYFHSHPRFIDQDAEAYSSNIAPIKLKAQPKGIDNEGGLTAIATLESISLVKDGSMLQEENVDYEPSCASISKDSNSLAVGDSGQGKNITMFGSIPISELNTASISCRFFTNF